MPVAQARRHVPSAVALRSQAGLTVILLGFKSGRAARVGLFAHAAEVTVFSLARLPYKRERAAEWCGKFSAGALHRLLGDRQRSILAAAYALRRQAQRRLAGH